MTGPAVTGVRVEGDTIHAGLHGAPRVAVSYGPGLGGYHFRPRHLRVLMRDHPDGTQFPITVEVRGRWPVGFLNVTRWHLDRQQLPPWLETVVGQVIHEARQ